MQPDTQPDMTSLDADQVQKLIDQGLDADLARAMYAAESVDQVRQDVLNALAAHIAKFPPPPPKEEAPIPDIMATPPEGSVRIVPGEPEPEPEVDNALVYLGRRVLFRMPTDHRGGAVPGAWRAADVVFVVDAEAGKVNLRVLLDGNNDGPAHNWFTNISPGYEPGQWTWPQDPRAS